MSHYRWDGGFAALEGRDGQHMIVVRPLNVPDEADEEVGPMYLVTFDDGETAHVFLEEIVPDCEVPTVDVDCDLCAPESHEGCIAKPYNGAAPGSHGGHRRCVRHRESDAVNGDGSSRKDGGQ